MQQTVSHKHVYISDGVWPWRGRSSRCGRPPCCSWEAPLSAPPTWPGRGWPLWPPWLFPASCPVWGSPSLRRLAHSVFPGCNALGWGRVHPWTGTASPWKGPSWGGRGRGPVRLRPVQSGWRRGCGGHRPGSLHAEPPPQPESLWSG